MNESNRSDLSAVITIVRMIGCFALLCSSLLACLLAVCCEELGGEGAVAILKEEKKGKESAKDFTLKKMAVPAVHNTGYQHCTSSS